MLNSYIDELYDQGLLEFNDKSIMSISLQGRLLLAKSDMEWYSFNADLASALDISEGWPIDKPYPIKQFQRYIWRGSEK